MAKTGKTAASVETMRVMNRKEDSSGVTRPRPRPGTGKATLAPTGNVRPQARPATPVRKSAASKVVAPTSTLSSSGGKTQPARPSTRPRSRLQTGQEPFQSTRDGMASRRIPVEAPATTIASRPQTRPQARPARAITFSRWKDMSRAERRAAGLPITDMPEASFNQAMSRK